MERIVAQKRTELGWESAGWFDYDAATRVLTENTRWDGENHIGVISGLQIRLAGLYRTKGGRWVEHTDARPEFNGAERWVFLTDEEARNWMLRSGGAEAEKALAEWFPATPEESGPGPQGGRPSVGPAISVAYPTDLMRRIEAAAEAAGVKRAVWLRKAAEAYLDAH